MDNSDSHLAGVLLSLSGGVQYRSNKITGEENMVFMGLVSYLEVMECQPLRIRMCLFRQLKHIYINTEVIIFFNLQPY